ncbi:hypothetical protein ANN_14664 [Periplaneta americana]|uniref:Uncharacterized protein n=1 Tax=Periplaneta americana TaxID=6978 RepID=A0ABQ8SWX6_PERAM|nr:hypothetical protein ANN_14664 [Periplaneta americana]
MVYLTTLATAELISTSPVCRNFVPQEFFYMPVNLLTNLPRAGIEPGPPGFAARRTNRYSTDILQHQRAPVAAGGYAVSLSLLHDGALYLFQRVLTTTGLEHPDLAPSDFHLFLDLKKFLSGQRFDGDDEVKTAVREWFASQAGEFHNEGIERLVPRLDKCLNNGGDYVEK